MHHICTTMLKLVYTYLFHATQEWSWEGNTGKLVPSSAHNSVQPGLFQVVVVTRMAFQDLVKTKQVCWCFLEG